MKQYLKKVILKIYRFVVNKPLLKKILKTFYLLVPQKLRRKVYLRSIGLTKEIVTCNNDNPEINNLMGKAFEALNYRG